MTMNMTCNDRDRVFEDGTVEEWAALETHAANCTACAEEIRAWQSLSVAAEELRDYSGGTALWSRIETALAEEGTRKVKAATSRGWFRLWHLENFGWQTVTAATFVLLLMISGGWIFFHGRGHTQPRSANLLKSRTLNEVEHAESAYVQAIDKLAAEAKPQLDNPATPLLSSYREKLLLLDSAIEDLRAQAGNNPSNAHLRYQLLSMYQEKQRTLEEVLEEKR
jgi:hypothetical protein